MSIIASSLGLTRYRIPDGVTDELLREVPEKLKQYRFIDIDNTTEERSFGWTNIDDMLDVEWTESPPEKADYFAFSLRLETRRVPPATLKKHLAIALKAETAKAKEMGREYVSRDRKREIKEQTELKLRARFLPIPATFDIVWQSGENRIYLDTTNKKAKDLFEDHFMTTFELRLEELSPFFLTMDMLGDDAAVKIENLDPTVFV